MSEPRPPIVWVLQEPRGAADLQDARAYGPLRIILSTGRLPSIHPGVALRELDQGLKDYRVGDYILQAPSDPVVPFLAGLILQARGHTLDRILWLRFDKARGADKPASGVVAGFYTPVTIDAGILTGRNRSLEEADHE